MTLVQPNMSQATWLDALQTFAPINVAQDVFKSNSSAFLANISDNYIFLNHTGKASIGIGTLHSILWPL